MLTISDGVTHGARTDTSGPAIASRLAVLGFEVTRGLAPDDRRLIGAVVRAAARRHPLVVTTGGTGLAPRDVTPEAIGELVDYVVPGFGEVMRAEGRGSTPFAALSRSLAGVLGRTLVVALPGSERGAVESFEAVAPLLDHALVTLRGETERHPPATAAMEANETTDRAMPAQMTGGGPAHETAGGPTQHEFVSGDVPPPETPSTISAPSADSAARRPPAEPA